MACMESASAWTTLSQRLQIAIVGAGWAGLAAAITATQKGHHVTLLEASKFWGDVRVQFKRTLKTIHC